MPPAPKHSRRWFQFSLGTMFLVVTVLALWLAWEPNIVRERQVALTWIRDYQIGYLLLEEDWQTPENRTLIENLKTACPERVAPTTRLRVPYIREVLGDKIIVAIGLKSKGDLSRIQSLFPEASILVPADNTSGSPGLRDANGR